MEEFVSLDLISALETCTFLMSKHFKVLLAYLISRTNAFMNSQSA